MVGRKKNTGGKWAWRSFDSDTSWLLNSGSGGKYDKTKEDPTQLQYGSLILLRPNSCRSPKKVFFLTN